MKNKYCDLELEIVLCTESDVIRTSVDDNVTEFPDFPEDFA